MENEEFDLEKFKNELENCNLYAQSLKEKVEEYITDLRIPLNERWKFFVLSTADIFKNESFPEGFFEEAGVYLTICGQNAFRYEGYTNYDKVSIDSWIRNAETHINSIHSTTSYSEYNYVQDPSILNRAKEIILKANAKYMEVLYVEESD